MSVHMKWTLKNFASILPHSKMLEALEGGLFDLHFPQLFAV